MPKWLENWRAKKEKLEQKRKQHLELEKKREEDKRKRVEEEEKKRRKKEENDERLRNSIIEIIESGKFPDMNWSISNIPFKFMKSEKMIWMFDQVSYYEHKVRREFVGRSVGTSVRIARGLSVRLGQSHGVPVEKEERVYRGSGPLAITTKHLYFYGERIFRIPFSKIVSAESLSDSRFIITRDRASGFPESFDIGNLNFANILVNAEFACELIHSIEGSGITPKSEVVEADEYNLLILSESGDYIG